MNTRVSVSLSDEDKQQVRSYVEDGRAERRALEQWAHKRGLQYSSSDSSVARLLLKVGAETLRERAIEDGYRRLAESRQTDASESVARRALRDRRTTRRS